jgi:hypothetical protein
MTMHIFFLTEQIPKQVRNDRRMAACVAEPLRFHFDAGFEDLLFSNFQVHFNLIDVLVDVPNACG